MASAAARRSARRRPARSSYLGRFESTAYGPPWDAMNGTGVTSTGVDLRDGKRRLLVAVDPGVIPYGTLLRIQPNPYGTSRPFVAADTGGAIVGKRIDLYVAEGRGKQTSWGRKPVRVWKVGKADGGAAEYDKAAQGQLAGILDALPQVDIPGLGGLDDVGGGGFSFPDALPELDLGALVAVLDGLGAFFQGLGELLLTPDGWVRLGKVIGGALLLAWGLSAVMKATTGTSPSGLARVTFGGALMGKRGAVGALIGGGGGGNG